MQRRLNHALVEAQKLPALEQKQSAIAIFRITLQHAIITLAEWIVNEYRRRDAWPLSSEPPISELRAPSDGVMVGLLAELLVVCENLGWQGVTRPLWEKVRSQRPAARLAPGKSPSLEDVLNGFVRERNDGIEGHGLPRASDVDAMLDVCALLLERLAPVLPEMQDDGTLVLRRRDAPNSPVLELKLLHGHNGAPVAYREIARHGPGRCRVRAQVLVTLTSSVDVTWEADDILGSNFGDEPGYAITGTHDGSWNPLTRLPERLTPYFRGRTDQLEELRDWLDDRESRACLVFGDGGFGKTTLVVEFLHRVLEGSISTKYRPEMITFYTAKKTRWGLTGLEYIRGGDVGVADVALDIVRALEGRSLGREWFDRESKSLIAKLSVHLREKWGVQRNDHLLILDNTETMAIDENDVKALAADIRELSKHVGRVIVTSRRREKFEARQIEVGGLSPEESVALLRARGTGLQRRQIIDAGDASLRKFAKQMGHRPLVLEVFVQILRDGSLSLQRSLDRVVQMEQQDLGEFLYLDAWNRLSDRVRVLLLLMTRIAEVHDEVLLKLCCQKAGVSILEANEALEESRGIAQLSRLEGELQVVFAPEFLHFCSDRTVSLDGTQLPTDTWVSAVRKRYQEFLGSRDAKIVDRVSRAYRTTFARAAYKAYQDGDWKTCEENYELAVVEDPENGLLFDRYAMFLKLRNRLEDALAKAQEATRLAPADPEVWFTKGMIEARMGLALPGRDSLERAIKNGKQKHLCYLQMAYGFSVSATPQPTVVLDLLRDAEQTAPSERDYYVRKHLAEVASLRRKTERHLEALRATSRS